MDAGPDGLTCLTFDGELMYDIFSSRLAMEKNSEKMLPRQTKGAILAAACLGILALASLLGLNWREVLLRSCRG